MSTSLNPPDEDIWRNLSLLDAQAWSCIPIVICSYTFLQSLIGFSSVCNAVVEIEPWAETVTSGACACFVVNCMFLLFRIFQIYNSWIVYETKQRSVLKIQFSLLTISSISASSMALTFMYQYGGICADGFGVHTPAAQWSEWFISVPFLAYLACAIESKSCLEKRDYIILISIALMIFFGFLMEVHRTQNWAMICYIISCLFMFIVFSVHIAMVREELKESNKVTTQLSPYQFVKLKLKRIRLSLLTKLCWIMLYFPLVYWLAAFKILTPSSTFVAYMIGGVIGKLFFSMFILDQHLKLFSEFSLLVTSARRVSNPNEINSHHNIRSETKPTLTIRKNNKKNTPQIELGTLGNLSITDFIDG